MKDPMLPAFPSSINVVFSFGPSKIQKYQTHHISCVLNKLCYPKSSSFPPSMKLAEFVIAPSQPFTPWPPRSNRNISLSISFRASSTTVGDRVIDFGKYKGRMIGSLPSTYLKWMSKNLRAGDTEEWAKLADRVLTDTVYRDRLEWEEAEKILSGYAAGGDGRNAVAELLEISERFGWDNDDKSGWSKIDFGLLGTSKGGRIPRDAARDNNAAGIGRSKVEKEKSESGGGGRRGERRERARLLREKTVSKETVRKGRDGERGSPSPASGGGAAGSPFPGREALLKKVLNRQTL